MSESLKRGLRDRSKRRHFDSENDEGDHFPYSKNYSRDFINPSQLLNQEAKLLVKFVNTANRYYSLYHPEKMSIDQEDPKVQDSKGSKKEQVSKESFKKGVEANRGMSIEVNGGTDIEVNRKGKQLYNGKNKQKSYSFKNENTKDKDHAATNHALQIEKSQSKNTKSNSLALSKALKQTSKAKHAHQADKDKSDSFNGVDKNKVKAADSKPFKRASYHVAISYLIYSLINQGQNAPKDPTLASRKLKEEMNRQH